MCIKVGSKVHYSKNGKKENGIVKTIRKNTTFVVYKCNEDWENYTDYTGVNTNLSDLTYGWVDEEGKLLKEFCDHYYIPSASKWEPINRRTCQWCGDIID